jgi:chromosome segregation and condensation protein ScpB
LAAALLSTRRPALADLAAALDTTVPAVRAGLVELAGPLAAVGIAVIDDGAHADLVLLPFTRDAVDALTRPDHDAAPVTLTPEAVTVLVNIGYLGEATRRQIDDRRGADSTALLDRLVVLDLLVRRTDATGRGHPHAYRLTTTALGCSGTPPPSPSTPGAPPRSTPLLPGLRSADPPALLCHGAGFSPSVNQRLAGRAWSLRTPPRDCVLGLRAVWSPSAAASARAGHCQMTASLLCRPGGETGQRGQGMP